MKKILTLILSILALITSAQTFRGGEVFRIKDSDVYWAAVKTNYFIESVARQEEDNWCWAACVQMVLNYQGVSVEQDEIVQRVFGTRINRGGTAYDIQKAADGWRTGTHTICAKVDNPYYVSALTFIEDLIDKYPLIIGLEMPGQSVGHAYVLAGMSFKKANGEYMPIEVILRDPWPTNPSRKKISWSDFLKRVHTIVHVYPK